ncbi:MAG: SiaC family regulatory phosphoprotein [Candidatus Absconditabacteria bacterium]|nr:SiaC family regulatory phosphoprotein [Candidatus Absconditabacteria bacterium]
MEKVVYSKENRKESYPFIGCFCDIGGIYYELTSFCERKKFFKEENSSQEKKVDGEKTVNELFKKIFPKENNVEKTKKKYILFYGKSAMENLSSFYNHLLFSITQEWIDDEEDIVIMLFLEYFNSGTAKALIQIINIIVSDFKKRARFIWLSDIDDSDSFDSGKEIREIVSFEGLNPDEMFHIDEVVYYFNKK